jgi:acyl-coenzyme A thioesterase PaaI-like protein
MTAVTVADLTALLAANEFTRVLRAKVTEVGDGRVTLEVPYRPENERPGGILSGQVYMHAADVAFWLAVKTRLGLEDGSVTSAMNTAFLGSARRETITCAASILRMGGRLVYGVAECFAGARLLTHHTLTYARPAAPGPHAPTLEPGFTAGGSSPR